MTLSKFLLAFVACTLDFFVLMSKTKILLWKIYTMRNIGKKDLSIYTIRYAYVDWKYTSYSIVFSNVWVNFPRPFHMFWQYIHNVTHGIDVSCTFPCFVVSVADSRLYLSYPRWKKKRIEHLTSEDDSVLVQREQYKLINLLYIITALTKLYTYSGRIW